MNIHAGPHAPSKTFTCYIFTCHKDCNGESLCQYTCAHHALGQVFLFNIMYVVVVESWSEWA